VRVAELLGRAGVPLGGGLRGLVLATNVNAIAGDGYQVVFSLGELDPALAGRDIIVADTADGKPLPDTQGRCESSCPATRVRPDRSGCWSGYRSSASESRPAGRIA
jgi:hypothetical protein